MRLLRTDALEFKSFNGTEQPSYAILSHRWSANGDDEISFEDVLKGVAPQKKAYAKLKGTMDRARSDGYDWLWCDTCCINQNSSAELSESINSMFAYYQDAARCYVYIEEQSITTLSDLASSTWFTRGWTLQELIAPKQLHFYSRDWEFIGSKKDPAVCNLISQITRIDLGILTGEIRLASLSVAKRMSWAAHREVSRQEDMAYCLMGIFDVNMPMIYGEGGQNAFHRLQEQIMKDSNDHSIFAWTHETNKRSSEDGHGLLADHPRDFARASAILAFNDFEDSVPYQPSNRGLRIDLHLTSLDDGTFAAALNCPIPSKRRGYQNFIAIILKKTAVGVNQYRRVRCHELTGIDDRGPLRTVYVRQKSSIQDHEALMPWHFFQLRNLNTPVEEYELLDAACFPLKPNEVDNAPRPIIRNSKWLASSAVSSFPILKAPGRLSAVVRFKRKSDGATFSLLLGSANALEPGFDVSRASDSVKSISELEKSFQPCPPGVFMDLGSVIVRVDVETLIDVPRKLYVVDITITNHERISMDGGAPLVSEFIEDVRSNVANLLLRNVSMRRPNWDYQI